MPKHTAKSHNFVDVSHTVEHGFVTYKGLPGPIITTYLSRDDSRAHYTHGTTFHIGKIEMVANTGTYVDAPFHRYPDGKDLSNLPLSALANLKGMVIRIDPEDGHAIGMESFQGRDLKGKAVLVHTGWSRHWGSAKYFEGHPFLTEEAVKCLRDGGAALVGIDSLNIDSTEDGRRPAHTILLEAEIPIVEHMTRLEQLPDSGFTFFAVPVKVRGFGSFPVRAFGIID